MPRDSVDTLYRDVGRAIGLLRNRRKPKMSQKELAEAIGISRASVANIERGHHRIQLHILYDIATALEVEPHDLLPHPEQQATRLPEDVQRELSPRERVAVDRLIRSGLTGASPDEKS